MFLRAVRQTGAAGAARSDGSCSQLTLDVAAQVLGRREVALAQAKENN